MARDNQWRCLVGRRDICSWAFKQLMFAMPVKEFSLGI
jgi:hypothetical protein